MDKTKQRQPLGSIVSHHSFDTKAQDKSFFQRSFVHANMHVCGEALDFEKENQELSWLPNITATTKSNTLNHYLKDFPKAEVICRTK